MGAGKGRRVCGRDVGNRTRVRFEVVLAAVPMRLVE